MALGLQSPKRGDMQPETAGGSINSCVKTQRAGKGSMKHY